MQAQALICDEKQAFSLQTVTLAEPGPNQIAIRTAYSAVSIGTEFALIRNKISWGPYPLCTGYMAAGIVEAVGAAIDNFRVGDRVYYRYGTGMTLPNGQKVSCASGAHCSHAVTDTTSNHCADHVPDGLGLDLASTFALPAVGLNGVDMANPRMGQLVVVHGAGLVGLGVVSAAANRGCVVVAVDLDAKRLEMARALGAEIVIDASKQDVPAEVKKLAPSGADVVFECTGLPQCVNPAIALCRVEGTFVFQGNYGAQPLPLNFLTPHGLRLKVFFPCDDGYRPCRRAVVRSMVRGALPWEKTITHRIRAAEAPELFTQINAGGHRDAGSILIQWD
jgi:2-desacetyl-2-hydroxyethyl bacteriochlorophyllide A dehydrogenase